MIVAVECHRACSEDDVVWLEPLEFIALIHGAAHFGVEAESLRIGTELLGRLRLKAGDGLQAQYFLPCAWSECNAIGASC